MLWISLLFGAISLGSVCSAAVDQLQKLQQEMDVMKQQIKKLESANAEIMKFTEQGMQGFLYSKTFPFLEGNVFSHVCLQSAFYYSNDVTLPTAN